MQAMGATQRMAEQPDREDRHVSVARLRKQFNEYLADKRAEVEEQKEARKYYHMVQWTDKQMQELKARKQPPVTTPIFARKVNGFVGLVERLRQDPKAYPRTPKHAQGAELSTAVLRYALDACQWPAITPEVARFGAIDGIAGVEIKLTPGDSGMPGDYDVALDIVEPDTFFYDPRSFRPDFSDARFMGVSKWVDVDAAKEMFPDQADTIDALMSKGDEFSIDSDREEKWSSSDLEQIRIVEHWYRRGNAWLYCFYTGSTKLMSGRSYLQDEKGADICRFIMFSSFVDHEGDRYGFHRNFKPLVDELNHRNSKALHLLNTRRIKVLNESVDDIEVLRREAVRPDGVILYNNPDNPPEFDDAKSLADMQGQISFLERNRNEIENYGPNPALVGQGVEAKSGRAIQLLQQAGIAELGPYILGLKNWKIRVYRAVWNAIRQHWKAERWVRVTDSEDQSEGITINQLSVDPMTGMPVTVNQVGALDVDIIIDEGPDTVTMAADALETLQSAMSNGAQVPPDVLIELMALPDSIKKRMHSKIEAAQQPNPLQQQAAQIELAQAMAMVEKTKAEAMRAMADAQSKMQPQPGAAPDAGPTDAELMEILASAEQKQSAAILNYAKAEETRVKTQLAPQEMAQRAALDQFKATQFQQRANAPR